MKLLEFYAGRVHLDIADGIFVPNETIKGYSELELISTGLKFDVHLMVKDPSGQIDNWENGKADRFIIHVESINVDGTIEDIRGRGKSVGLALNPSTPNSSVETFIQGIDLVQFMTIDPGFQGRDFIPQVVEKIRDFRQRYPAMPIAVDGGINLATAKEAISAGANIIVSGSFILKSGNVGKAIAELREAVQNF